MAASPGIRSSCFAKIGKPTRAGRSDVVFSSTRRENAMSDRWTLGHRHPYTLGDNEQRKLMARSRALQSWRSPRGVRSDRSRQGGAGPQGARRAAAAGLPVPAPACIPSWHSAGIKAAMMQATRTSAPADRWKPPTLFPDTSIGFLTDRKARQRHQANVIYFRAR